MPFPEDPTKSEITFGMENALSSAEDYLDYSAFSKKGLIDQLSSAYGSQLLLRSPPLVTEPCPAARSRMRG